MSLVGSRPRPACDGGHQGLQVGPPNRGEPSKSTEPSSPQAPESLGLTFYFPFILRFSGLCCFSCSFSLALWVRVVCPSPSTRSKRHNTHLPAGPHTRQRSRTQPPPPNSTTPAPAARTTSLTRITVRAAVALSPRRVEPAQIPERNSGAMGKAWEKLELGLRVE